ncbi:MAG: Broad specificity phosphatase PhoE [Chloroflexi bacterium AL-W]|nr:Broad specificity phosphatase PhoE [Chloroflexi bacterium AL-N1]NOK70532.1 Broad specificity phosphatase PhoE [Chloroflexi bacterium AL-N10]NOK78109.1 Broad specificity phosphatase PhoE [Chloroflexi bacterium AL-N5]NOK85208.1 Broad specificity phosphatase PhoE [Chloroflexi bacterium AL-W]NOK91973.1 Broad specificity phosphatase PhoE [Chloroflexi bacterium AL-N15]
MPTNNYQDTSEMPDVQPLPQRRRIVLMRHGEVNYFQDGQPVAPDLAQLTEDGHTQAQAAAQTLIDVPFDAAISTGLVRTDNTLRIVLGQRNLASQTVPDLQEIRADNIGHMANLSPQEMRTMLTQAFTRSIQPDDHFLLGETFGVFRERIVAAFRAILTDSTWRCLLLVAHGATNRVILADVFGAQLDFLGHIEQDAACINIIDVDEHGYGILRLLNYTPYNPIKTGLSLTTMERYFLAAQSKGR